MRRWWFANFALAPIKGITSAGQKVIRVNPKSGRSFLRRVKKGKEVTLSGSKRRKAIKDFYRMNAEILKTGDDGQAASIYARQRLARLANARGESMPTMSMTQIRRWKKKGIKGKNRSRDPLVAREAAGRTSKEKATWGNVEKIMREKKVTLQDAWVENWRKNNP